MKFKKTIVAHRYTITDKGSTIGIAWKTNSKWGVCDKYRNVLGTSFGTRQQAGEHLVWMMKERFGS